MMCSVPATEMLMRLKWHSPAKAISNSRIAHRTLVACADGESTARLGDVSGLDIESLDGARASEQEQANGLEAPGRRRQHSQRRSGRLECRLSLPSAPLHPR